MDNPSVYRDRKVRTMRDTIYRDDAIEAIDKRIYALMKDPEYRRKGSHIDLYGAKELLRDLPSANRPQGEWLWQLADNGWADHICSVCGYTKNTDIHVSLNWSYCPNCGADMRKGVDNE